MHPWRRILGIVARNPTPGARQAGYESVVLVNYHLVPGFPLLICPRSLDPVDVKSNNIPGRRRRKWTAWSTRCSSWKENLEGGTGLPHTEKSNPTGRPPVNSYVCRMYYWY